MTDLRIPTDWLIGLIHKHIKKEEKARKEGLMNEKCIKITKEELRMEQGLKD